MKRAGNLLFYFISFFLYPVGGFYFFTHLNLLCCSVNLSNGETMVTNNLLCFNEKYVSWWETKPGINTEGTLNNGPLAGVCPKLCCSFLLTAIHPCPRVALENCIPFPKKTHSIWCACYQNM